MGMYAFWTNEFCVLLSRIVTDGEKREVWRLYVENVSTTMKPEETEREQNMYKDVSLSQSSFLAGQSRITIDFHVNVNITDFFCF